MLKRLYSYLIFGMTDEATDTYVCPHKNEWNSWCNTCNTDLCSQCVITHDIHHFILLPSGVTSYNKGHIIKPAYHESNSARNLEFVMTAGGKLVDFCSGSNKFHVFCPTSMSKYLFNLRISKSKAGLKTCCFVLINKRLYIAGGPGSYRSFSCINLDQTTRRLKLLASTPIDIINHCFVSLLHYVYLLKQSENDCSSCIHYSFQGAEKRWLFAPPLSEKVLAFCKFNERYIYGFGSSVVTRLDCCDESGGWTSFNIDLKVGHNVCSVVQESDQALFVMQRLNYSIVDHANMTFKSLPHQHYSFGQDWSNAMVMLAHRGKLWFYEGNERLVAYYSLKELLFNRKLTYSEKILTNMQKNCLAA